MSVCIRDEYLWQTIYSSFRAFHHSDFEESSELLHHCQLNLLLIWQILYICTTHQTLLQTCSSFLKIHNRFLVNTISLYKLHIVVENKNSVQTYRGSWRMNECQLVSCLYVDCILHSRVDGKKQFIFGIWHWTVPSSWSVLKGW